jgi:predicted nucleic acid-binding protein
VIAPDTSVVVAALAPWHSSHAVARQMLSGARARRLPVHVAFETCSTLSRMPEGERVASQVVYRALEMLFPDAWLHLEGSKARRALETAVAAGVRGGALYDALIAATARAHGARLLSFDRRALSTYESIGVDVEVLAV